MNVTMIIIIMKMYPNGTDLTSVSAHDSIPTTWKLRKLEIVIAPR